MFGHRRQFKITRDRDDKFKVYVRDCNWFRTTPWVYVKDYALYDSAKDAVSFYMVCQPNLKDMDGSQKEILIKLY